MAQSLTPVRLIGAIALLLGAMRHLSGYAMALGS